MRARTSRVWWVHRGIETVDENEVGNRIHELRLKTMILELIVDEMYTEDELNYLIEQGELLEILYSLLRI